MGRQTKEVWLLLDNRRLQGSWKDGRALGGGLAVTEESHGQVLDVGGPLGGQLEELHVVPLHTIDGHWREEEKHKPG